MVDNSGHRVLKAEEVRSIVLDIHASIMHAGRDKVYLLLKQQELYGITKQAISDILDECLVCKRVNPVNVPRPLQLFPECRLKPERDIFGPTSARSRRENPLQRVVYLRPAVLP